MPEFLYPLLAAVVGAAVTLVTIRATKRKVIAEAKAAEADAAQTIQNASLALIAPLSARIEGLEAEVRLLRMQIERQADIELEMRAEARRKEKRIRHLEEVCRAAGINGHDLPPVDGR